MSFAKTLPGLDEGKSPALRGLRQLLAPCSDRELESIARPLAGDDATAFWPDNAPLRAAVPFQRVHQQLQILRFFARQSDSAGDAAGRESRRGSPAPRGRGIPQHFAGRGRASEIRVEWLPRSLRARRVRGSRGAGGVTGGRADGNPGVFAPGCRRCGGAGGLSGNLSSRSPTRSCTPPVRSAISTGDWIARSARMTPGSGGWGSGRCSVSPSGARKR